MNRQAKSELIEKLRKLEVKTGFVKNEFGLAVQDVAYAAYDYGDDLSYRWGGKSCMAAKA